MQGYLSFLMQTGFDFINACVTEPEPTLEYNGNPCDYPLIALGAWWQAGVMQEGNVVSSSYIPAQEEVLEMIEDGDMTLAEATFLIPSVGGVMLTWAQLQQFPTTVLFMNAAFICGADFMFTGNPCDYPALVVTPFPNFPGFISGDSFHNAWVSIFEQGVMTGQITPQMATYYLPDLSNDGFISIIDLVLMLELLANGPIECSELGEPGGIKPVKPIQVQIASALGSAFNIQKKKQKKV